MKQTLAVSGSIILLVGLFFPSLSSIATEEASYFFIGIEGFVVFILCIISLVLALLKQFRFIWLTGFSIVALFIYTFFRIRTALHELQTSFSSGSSGSPGSAFLKMMADDLTTVQLKWGVAIIAIGILLLFFSAALRAQEDEQSSNDNEPQKFHPEEASKKCPRCAETIKMEAVVCKFCGHEFTPEETAQQIAEARREFQINQWRQRRHR